MPSNDAPAHEIVPADEQIPDLLAQCVQLRVAVFIDEQKFDPETEIDKYDAPGKSTHLLLRLVPSLEPIGTIRIVHLSATEKKLGRLCVLKEYRNFKFGKDLVLAAHDYLVRRQDRTSDSSPLTVSLHSQIYVKGFYAKCGYEETGAEFDEDVRKRGIFPPLMSTNVRHYGYYCAGSPPSEDGSMFALKHRAKKSELTEVSFPRE